MRWKMTRIAFVQLVGGDEHEVCHADTPVVPRKGDLVWFPAPLPSADPGTIGEFREWFVSHLKVIVGAFPPGEPEVIVYMSPAGR